MRNAIVLLILMAALASGCLENIGPFGEKVPIIFMNVTVEDDGNGTILMKEISAIGDETTKSYIPTTSPKDFPAIYISVFQNLTKANYPSGRDYTGPGMYDFPVGLKPGFNTSMPMSVMVSVVDKQGDYVFMQNINLTWSKEEYIKTFK